MNDYDDYNDFQTRVDLAEDALRDKAAADVAQARSSARFEAFKAQQDIANNWNKAITETFGSQAEFDRWAAENPEEHRTLLLEGMANFAKSAHIRSRDSKGRFFSTPAGKKNLKEISESRASGRLSSDQALDRIVRSVLFGGRE